MNLLKIEFLYVNKCPRVHEMAKNIKNAITKLDFEYEYVEKIIHENMEANVGFGCPTLLVNGRDLVGKIKCDLNKPFCRVYAKGIPTSEEIKKFILCNY